MKITRRQLRRIIKEAIDPNADQQEAAYAIIYAEAYVAKFNEICNLALYDPKIHSLKMYQPSIKVEDLSLIHI